VDILGNQVHPVVQMFPNNDTVFQGDSSPILSARNVHSWCEQHEDALHHLPWPAQLPDLNVTEPLVSFREWCEKQISSSIIF
jgi:hypothetical protein